MTTLIDNTFNQESWGASLKAYKETKNSLGYVQQPPHHETTYAHSRDERENKVDPVLQVFRDPTKEQNLRSWEDTHNIHGLNKSFDLQLTRESQFNVVNNQSKKDGLEGVDGSTNVRERPNLSLQSGVHYNILSNHNHEDHALPDKHRDELDRAYTPQKAHKRFGIAPKWTEKDYDMISNKYHYGHDQWEATQRAGALDTAAEKFFARNDKNPVTGKFYDGAKEDDVANAEEQQKLTHGVHQMDIFPPRVKYGPGMAFDLATHTVKDGELFQLLREKDEEKRRGAYRACEKRDLEERYKAERDGEAFMKDGRRYMRIDEKRYTETQDRGYDVVTNEALQGRDCKPTFPHRLPSRHHFWDTLGASQEDHARRMQSKKEAALDTARSRGLSAPAGAEVMSVHAEGGGNAEGDVLQGQPEPQPYVPPSRGSMASSRRGSVASSRSYRSARSGSGMSASQPLRRPDHVPPVALDRMSGRAEEPPRTHSSWRSGSTMRSRRSGMSGRSSVRSVRSNGFGGLEGF
eukprot:COSAG04_NODE_957_length_9173_cov_27.835133_7_plen_519_part_00